MNIWVQGRTQKFVLEDFVYSVKNNKNMIILRRFGGKAPKKFLKAALKISRSLLFGTSLGIMLASAFSYNCRKC